MAQKQRRPPLDEPPTASSSDSEDDHQVASQHQDKEEDDEATSSDDATSSEEEDDDEQQHRIQPSLQLASKISPPAPSISHPKPSSDDSATESDAGSDSESEPEPPVPNPKVKPLASKPMENNTPKVKALPSPAAPPRSGSKRSVENNAHVPDPKRAKKKVTSVSASAGSDEEIEDGKKLGDDPKPLFQRVFSEEDVIAILKGIVDFTSKTGLDPYKNADQFYDFVKKSLHSGANSNQVKEKIRRLKKKFEVNLGKGKNGEDPSFSKPHEQESFELSKKIWSGEAVEKGKPNGKPAKTPKKEVNNKNVASDKKLKPEMEAVAEVKSEDLKEPEKMEVDVKRDDSTLLSEMLSFEKGIGLSGLLNEDAVKRGLDLIGASKRAELEGKWKELHISSLELLEKRAQLIHDQAGLILEAYKLSNH